MINKKGSILDIIYLLVIILVMFIVFAIGKIVFEKTTESGALQGGYTETASIVNRYNALIIPSFDKWFIFVVFGGYMAIFILAFFIKGTPAFLPIMIILIMITTVIAVFVSNAQDYIVDHSTLIRDATSSWTMTTFLIEHLPLINLFMLVGLIIVMLSMGGGL